MSTVSPSAADAVERLLRAAGRHVRELDAIPTSRTARETTTVPAPREPLDDTDDTDGSEVDAATLAMALESRNLRARAARVVSEVEGGGSVEITDVRALVRAFRSYRPFLRDRERERNDTIHRRLVRIVRAHDSPPPEPHPNCSVRIRSSGTPRMSRTSSAAPTRRGGPHTK